MMILSVFLFFLSDLQAVPHSPFNMHQINGEQDGYCLLHHVDDHLSVVYRDYFVYDYVHETNSYCFRPTLQMLTTIEPEYEQNIGSKWTLADLSEANVTIEMLLAWSATIDFAEDYQIFLNDLFNFLLTTEQVFYNCTGSWFGPYCRFAFDNIKAKSFDDVVVAVFNSKTPVNKGSRVSCYIHLYCRSDVECIDWREICDGKNDCLDGSDEEQCWQLEINQCTDNEYRCHNGQCIPKEFFRDGTLNPDCLDRTDESHIPDESSRCHKDPAFRCEEHRCRNSDEFPCGDGRCTNGIYRCFNGRTMFSSSMDFCSNATSCFMRLTSQVDGKWCNKFCPTIQCFKNNCSRLFEFRSITPLLGHIRLIFSNEPFMNDGFPLPELLCYDKQRCIDYLLSTITWNNQSCRLFNETGFTNLTDYFNVEQLVYRIKEPFLGCSTFPIEKIYCNDSIMYRCLNSSKCISKQRLLDGIRDCPWNDDETFNDSCSLFDHSYRFRCSTNQCFASLVIQDQVKHCPQGEDEFSEKLHWRRTHIYFPAICDGKIDLSPLVIDGKNETDETECHHWPCNNMYTRCDRIWLCSDGADEVNCLPSTCPFLQHNCIDPRTPSKLSCLPLNQSGDGIDHCLGGTDERMKYLAQGTADLQKYRFHCWNNSKVIEWTRVCNKELDCPYQDDELICEHVRLRHYLLCINTSANRTSMEDFLCDLNVPISESRIVYFTLQNQMSYPLGITVNQSMLGRALATSNPTNNDPWWCHRGIAIRYRLTINTSEYFCLCPPSYYGVRCEYQNQRVSLTLHIQMISDWREMFIFLITLVDNEREIHSYKILEYTSIRDCLKKFNIYLLYSQRPKNASKIYSVQIDAYNQLTLNYRASWIFPLKFPFLPVHRLPLILRLPFASLQSIDRCSISCLHGRCFHYVNDQASLFCQCQSGWSGLHCGVQTICHCAPDSLCIDESICLCPRTRYGRRCHLKQNSCQNHLCLHGGQCVPENSTVICICPQGYRGDRCEIREEQIQIDLSFHSTINVPSSVFVHFLTAKPKDRPQRTSLMKKIPFNQDRLTIVTSVPFHLAFAQINDDYYLIVLHEKLIVSGKIFTDLVPSHRCRPVRELFNQTFLQQHFLQRIKFYHQLCETQSSIICFSDHVHLCLCQNDRQANCVEFDHQMTYDCQGSNFCLNGAPCFQDDLRCPRSAFCACHQCYFGSKCQFSTKGSTLSLDIILGYHIDRTLTFFQQKFIVKCAMIVTLAIFIIGMVNSLLCFQTFRGIETRNVGCGWYLLTSSIISIFIMILFAIKYFLLVFAVTQRQFQSIQCRWIDYLLRSCSTATDWLSICVAIERGMTIFQGIHFDQRRSQRVAKWMIAIVVLCSSLSFSYEPLYRELTEDEEEKRIWCVSTYTSSVQRIDGFLNIFHFIIPFAINCSSALMIIFLAARMRSNSQKKHSFKNHLYQQIQTHKHLLISPCILILLSLPRLIISFLSGCMKSARDSWFYFMAYYISFLPPMLTFVIFVLPSKMYKHEFYRSIKSFWRP